VERSRSDFVLPGAPERLASLPGNFVDHLELDLATDSRFGLVGKFEFISSPWHNSGDYWVYGCLGPLNYSNG
jgi:hypothetical protein